MNWDLVKYGWNPCYWLTIGGIPVAFSEVATGQVPPTGYTIDPCLVIDSSSAIGSTINRDNGSANAMPLSFRLIDSVNGTASTAATWIKKWSKQCTLTADLTASATTLTVDDTTGWSNGDYIYAGGECILIGTVATGTTFTGCTRGCRGTLAAIHRTGVSGQLATDRPRLRGAEVVLYATPMDPGGFATGWYLAADATILWRGRVAEVRRAANGFDFECTSLDRLLDTPLVAKMTGKVESTKHMNPIVSSWWLSVQIVGTNAAGAGLVDQIVKIQPFTSITNGTLAYSADTKKLIVDAWATAVAAIGGLSTYVGDLDWINGVNYDGSTLLSVHLKGLWNTAVTYSVMGSTPKVVKGNGGGIPDQIGFWQTINPCGGSELGSGGDTLTIAVAGNPADVPAGKGRITVKASSATYAYQYATATAADGVVYLTQVVPLSAKTPYLHNIPGGVAGADAEFQMTSTGTPATLALRALESSGTASLRGTYDTLPQGAGYGIPATAINEDSFLKLLGGGAFDKLTATTSTAGSGFFDLYGGMLGLFRRGVAMRPDANGVPKLTAISTQVGGSDWTLTITDADLLTLAGEPVGNIDKLQAANVIKVTRSGQVAMTDGGSSDEDASYFTDDPSVEAEGAREAEFAVPADSYADWHATVQAAALAMFGIDQTLQSVTLHVGPWVNAQVGDCVQLNITHSGLYSWASGTTGLTGIGRVTGRVMDPRTLAVTLTILCEGNVTTHSLSPAMKVTAHTGTGANPSSITVADKYHKHLSTALDFAGGPIDLSAYDPGDVETTSRYVTVSAVSAPSGGSIVLTTSGMSGGSVTDGTTYLTLPTSSPSGPSITSYQAGFAHDQDGSYWT